MRTAGTTPTSVCLIAPGSQNSRVTRAAPTAHTRPANTLRSQAFGALTGTSMTKQRPRRSIGTQGFAALSSPADRAELGHDQRHG